MATPKRLLVYDDMGIIAARTGDTGKCGVGVLDRG